MTQKRNYFVTTISLALAEQLREDLVAQGFTLSTPPYTLFSAQKKGISCTLYTSGKLSVQGKEMEEFITFYLEPEILKTLEYSHPEVGVELTPHIGIDESGKGDFFGPLCIAGVYANQEQIKKLLSIGIKESKAVSDATCKTLSERIKKICPYSLVLLRPQKYNELYGKFHNLNRLLAWGHATAIEELVQKTECRNVVIDQFAAEDVVEKALQRKGLKVDLTQRHRAESDPVVAAASLIARAGFLTELEHLSQLYHIQLPKGASSLVVKVGRQLVDKYGPDILEKVGKVHFKTKTEILLYNA